MKSLQETALVVSILRTNYNMQHLLGKIIDFSKLKESTLYLIWYLYNDKEIIDKIPHRFMVNDWWYNDCKTCTLKGCKECESDRCECEDCTCKHCGYKCCGCSCSDSDYY